MYPKGSDVKQMMYFNGSSYYIFDFKQGDVNGDGTNEDVYIVGDKPYGEESPFASDIAIAIYDSKTNAYTKIPLKMNSGYRPKLFLGDFTGDRINDILINIDSGGSGGLVYSYVYSFIEDKPRNLFNFEKFNEKYEYQVKYRDYYKVDIINVSLNRGYTLDISNRDRKYLSDIYSEKGKLKDHVNGEVLPLSGLYPIDVDWNDNYELLAVQRIIGRYNADTLGFIETYLRWKDGRFVPFRQYVNVLGDDNR